MKNNRLHRLVAVLGLAACLTSAGELRAQDLLEKKDNTLGTQNPAASFGAEYQLMFQYVEKLKAALQSSTDKDSTAANLTALPKSVDGKVEAEASIQASAKVRERGLQGLSVDRDITAQPFLSWFLSKDFNLDDPFEAMMDSKRFVGASRIRDRDGDEVDAMAEAIAVPQFKLLAGLTNALDSMMKAKDAELTSSSRVTATKDSKDFDPLTYLLSPSAPKDKE
ncbi:hypothetical protein FBR05_07630 [Deltaproteobacteria bacterium PRO3]|nr:hypothetical protein [Deltaproteobacteria bacterium PRO3]